MVCLFSETFKIGIVKIKNSANEIFEPLYLSGKPVGFHLGGLQVLSDDDLPLFYDPILIEERWRISDGHRMETAFAGSLIWFLLF